MVFLSIIVPVFNKEKFIDECIKSILKQTFTDFELILINDGSTDKSGLICDQYKNIDNRIIVFHQENKGVSAARNLGLKNAKGKYVGFVDSDDLIEVDMYEILSNNALVNNADISIISMRTIFPNKSSFFFEDNKIKIYNKDEGISAALNGQLFWSANNKIYKAEIAKKKLFEGFIHEDVLYTFYAFYGAEISVFQNVIKYNYIIRDNSASMSSFNIKYMETIMISKKIVEFVSENIKSHLEEAEIFDFVKNISLLNILLLSDNRKYHDEYNLVVANLNGYSSLLKGSKNINRKHRLAYYLFKTSPMIYSHIMHLYCLINDTEVLKRR